MPQSSVWSSLIKEWVEKENDCFGVYYLSDEHDTVLYIGNGHILTNLKSHLVEGLNPLRDANQYRVEYAANERQADKNMEITLKEWEKKHGQLPKYNLAHTQVVS